jgi:hypothetical protein
LEAFTPTDDELDALPKAWAHRLLGPVPPAGTLPAIVRRFPEMRFYRRISDGSFVTALWNPARARQIYLDRLPPALRVARVVWNAARSLSRAQPFPAANDPIQTVEMAFTVRERLDGSALRQLAGEAHALGGHVFNVVSSGLAPGEKLDVPGIATHMRTRLFLLSVVGAGGETLADAPRGIPLYFDLSVL